MALTTPQLYSRPYPPPVCFSFLVLHQTAEVVSTQKGDCVGAEFWMTGLRVLFEGLLPAVHQGGGSHIVEIQKKDERISLGPCIPSNDKAFL